MTLLHSELCFCDFRSPSFCSALSPKEGFGREVDFRTVRSPPVGILLWSSAGGRRDGPRNLKGPARSWAASCRGSAFLQQLSRGPILLPPYEGRPALKAACSSLKNKKKKKKASARNVLSVLSPGGLCTHCSPAQAQSCPFPLNKQILRSWRGLYFLGMPQGTLDLINLFHARGGWAQQ